MSSARNRWVFLASWCCCCCWPAALVPLKMVLVKMLPFDNKSEFQVMVNMPDGTPLEQTTRVAQALGAYLGQQPEVANYQIYAGTSGPFNFNGLVRHYYLRQSAQSGGHSGEPAARRSRSAQSHAIARRLRPELDRIGAAYGARMQVAEVPPGPPVLQTLVAEIYGPEPRRPDRRRTPGEANFQQTPGVVDTDWYMQDPQPQLMMHVDEAKAALHGIAVARSGADAGAGCIPGMQAGLLHVAQTRGSRPDNGRIRSAGPSGLQALENIKLRGADGSMVSLRELVDVEHTTLSRYLSQESEARGLRDRRCGRRGRKSGLRHPEDEPGARQADVAGRIQLARYNSVQPESTDHYSMKWDGEWQITIEVFRDLGSPSPQC